MGDVNEEPLTQSLGSFASTSCLILYVVQWKFFFTCKNRACRWPTKRHIYWELEWPKKSNKDNYLLLFLIFRLLSGSPNIFPQGLYLQSEAPSPTHWIISASPLASLYSPASPKVLDCLFPIMQCSFIQVKEHQSHCPSFHNKFLGPKLFSEIVTFFSFVFLRMETVCLLSWKFLWSRKDIRFHGRYYPIQELALWGKRITKTIK